MTHLAFAVVIGILIVSGLGVAESLPPQVTFWLGGHVLLSVAHHLVGHVLEFGLLLLPLLVLDRLQGLVGSMARFHRFEAAWPIAFARFSLRRRRYRPPWHSGRFDPVQRLVFLALTGSLAVVVLTGLAFNLVPRDMPQLFAWVLRIHIAAAILLIGSVCVHIVAASGLLSTHRGIARAMFGDGRVGVPLSSRLWPGWTAKQIIEDNGDSGSGTPSGTSDQGSSFTGSARDEDGPRTAKIG